MDSSLVAKELRGPRAQRQKPDGEMVTGRFPYFHATCHVDCLSVGNVTHVPCHTVRVRPFPVGAEILGKWKSF